MRRSVLVVGAGFAGATCARELAESGYDVVVIDRRPHIGGNAYDYVDANGVRVHRYGPHFFHTSNETVADWLFRFGRWIPYEHRVSARLADGQLVPLPINRRTMATVFGCPLETPADAESLLERVRERIAEPRNAAEYLYSKLGKVLTDLFFRPYTQKMWALDLEDIHPAVVKRIPMRLDVEDRYFPGDRFQKMPADGYESVFAAIFDHPRIRVHLSTDFDRRTIGEFLHCFNSMAIDEYFEFRHGELPYRSIRFHHRDAGQGEAMPCVQTNFTDDGPYTRETHWALIPAHGSSEAKPTTLTREEPCDYRDNERERYYPVRTADDRHAITYKKYLELAGDERRLTFVGRCGTYQYLDMHQVINQSLRDVRAWIASNPKA